jgi:hypothetical protein
MNKWGIIARCPWGTRYRHRRVRVRVRVRVQKRTPHHVRAQHRSPLGASQWGRIQSGVKQIGFSVRVRVKVRVKARVKSVNQIIIIIIIIVSVG